MSDDLVRQPEPAEPLSPVVSSLGPVPPAVEEDADNGLINILVDAPEMLYEPYRSYLVGWLSRGYTLRRIQGAAVRAGWPIIPSAKAVILARAEYVRTGELQAARENEGQSVLSFGLARQEERVRRLTQIAERLEPYVGIDQDELAEDVINTPKAAPPNLKMVTAYQKILEQIQSETSDLGLKVSVTPDDQWMTLLTGLRRPRLPAPNENQSTPSSDSSAPESTKDSQTSFTVVDGRFSSRVESAPASPTSPASTE